MNIRTAPTTLGMASPKDLREYKPRLTFNWRCENCDSTWTGGVTTAYCCGLYAVDADEYEQAERNSGVC